MRMTSCRSTAFFLGILFAAFATGVPSMGRAADYPTKTVRIICPFPAGGTADIVARLVAQMLSEAWTQPVVVENKAGAAGNIGADLVAKSEPDGYTLLVSPPPPYAVNVSLYKHLPYDARTAFAPISIVAQAASVLVANPKVPYHSVKELVAYAKANPHKINYASQGSGTTSHLTTAMMAQMTGIDIVHIPYKGSAPALADLLGGQVDFIWDNLGSSLPRIQDGSLLGLAVGSKTRSPGAPNIPTMIELGYPGFVSVAWFAAAAPAHTPQPIIDQISSIIAKSLKKPELEQRMAKIGVDPVGSTPQQMAEFVKEETERWAGVIKSAGIQQE